MTISKAGTFPQGLNRQVLWLQGKSAIAAGIIAYRYSVGTPYNYAVLKAVRGACGPSPESRPYHGDAFQPWRLIFARSTWAFNNTEKGSIRALSVRSRITNLVHISGLWVVEPDPGSWGGPRCDQGVQAVGFRQGSRAPSRTFGDLLANGLSTWRAFHAWVHVLPTLVDKRTSNAFRNDHAFRGVRFSPTELPCLLIRLF